MGTGAKVGITIGVLFLGLLVFLVGSYFSYANTAVDYETRIETGVENNRQVLGQYRLKVTEQIGVAGLQADQFEQVYVKAIDARYKNGMGQMMAWIKEQNPQLGTEVYTTIQRTMDAGRTDFAAAQTRLLDVCRGYKRLQRQPYSGFWLNVAGKPSAEYQEEGGNGKLCRAVTSQGAKEAFETGVEEAIDVRGEPKA